MPQNSIRVKFVIFSALAALFSVTVSAAEIVQSEFIYPLDGGPTPSCHASTIVETPEGTLIAAWFGGSAEGKDDVCIWLSRREKQDRGSDKDSGWSTPICVAAGEENGEQVPCWNPVLFQWRDGPLVLFYKVGRDIDWWRGEMLVSRDDGKTSGEKQRLPEFFVGPVKNKPVQLADGSLLAGSSVNAAQGITHQLGRFHQMAQVGVVIYVVYQVRDASHRAYVYKFIGRKSSILPQHFPRGICSFVVHHLSGGVYIEKPYVGACCSALVLTWEIAIPTLLESF